MARAGSAGPHAGVRGHRLCRRAHGFAFSYISLKQIDVDKRVKYSYIGFVILPMLFLISVDPPTMLFAMFISYATYGPVQWLARRLRRPRGAGAA